MRMDLRPVEEGRPTFAGFPRAGRLEDLDADVAVLGLPYRSRYAVSAPPFRPVPGEGGPEAAPAALRRASQCWAHSLGHYDFDFEGELFAGRRIAAVDCGDLLPDPADPDGSSAEATRVVETILSRGAVPLVLGGDHGTPIPVLRAFREKGPLCVVQIDAHLDFRDEREGVRDGFSSPMRRASELPWVDGLVQIGLRGVGSARREEVEAARAAGSLVVRAQDLHRLGVEAVLERLPPAGRFYVTIDADGLDPSIAPGVYYPSPGGLDYYQATGLLRGLAVRAPIVGMDFDELVPGLDPAGHTALFASRLLLNALGALAWSGRIGR